MPGRQRAWLRKGLLPHVAAPAAWRVATAGRPLLTATTDCIGQRVWLSMSTNRHAPKTPVQPVSFRRRRHPD